jgi:hypothetical protein
MPFAPLTVCGQGGSDPHLFALLATTEWAIGLPNGGWARDWPQPREAPLVALAAQDPPDPHLLGLDQQGRVWAIGLRSGDWVPNWPTPAPAPLTRITAEAGSDAHLFGLDANHNLSAIGLPSGVWVHNWPSAPPAPLVAIAAQGGNDPHLFGLDANHNLYAIGLPGGGWVQNWPKQPPVPLIALAAQNSPDPHLFGLDVNYDLWAIGLPRGAWVKDWPSHPPLKLAQISVQSGPDAHLFGIDASTNIWACGVPTGRWVQDWPKPLPRSAVKIDQGAQVSTSGNITAPNVGALQFGNGDFTVAALFQTTHGGTVASKKSAGGGSPSYAGWQVVVRPDGTIKFATDNGFGFYEVDSVATTALDGQWHHLAAVRRGGQLSLYFDGQPLSATTRSSLPAPLNVSGSEPLMIGATQQVQEPYNQFAGVIEDVVLFNRGLAQQELPACMFNLLTGSEPGLVGLYRFNGNGYDDSPSRNDASPNGNVTYVPVYHCAWADGDNAFSYLSITSLHDVPQPGQRAQAPPAEPGGPAITRTQSLFVAAGSPYLCASICDDSGLLAFPTGATVTLRDPSSRIYNQDVDTSSLYVKTDGDGSSWVVVAATPAAGKWTVTITAPAGVNFNFSMLTMPSKNLIDSIERAMSPVLPPVPPHTSAELALARTAAADDDGLWGYVGAGALGAVGTAFLVATGAVTLPAALIGLAAYNGALTIGLATQMFDDLRVVAPTPPIAASQAAQYMAKGYNNGPRPLTEVVNTVRAKVGVPSTTNPARFASRADMGVDGSYHVHLDVGGEGYHEVYGIASGFRNAINLNAQTADSQPPYGQIPMLVQVPDWPTNPPYPFIDGIADYITMQGAPLTAKNVSEIARVLRIGGKAGLWIDRDEYQGAINQLAQLLGCTPTYSTDPGSGCTDEFDGRTGWPKVCLQRNR